MAKESKGWASFRRPLKNWSADARLFELEPSFNGNRYIVVVAAVSIGGYEMLMYPCDENGELKRWKSVVPGKRSSVKDHLGFIRSIGYETVGDVTRKPRMP